MGSKEIFRNLGENFIETKICFQNSFPLVNNKDRPFFDTLNINYIFVRYGILLNPKYK